LLFCGRRGSNGALATLESDLKLLDVTKGNVPRIAALQFSLGLEFVHGLLLGSRSLLNLAFSLLYVGSCNQHLCLGLRNFAPRTFRCRLLLGAIQPEDGFAFADWSANANVNVGDTTVDLRNDRDGSKE